MSQYERKETAVRRLLESAQASVPPGLFDDAVRRGGRMLRRRVVLRRLMWVVLFACVVAFAVWASAAQPWAEPPSETTPPLTRW
ncbi:hypothetical protein GKQ77_07175 [Streptomyces sp. BG9H]|uniref:Uncharacterized protein n=1 Tax=Streptomyces anatolicus TaxID=2675858 RepID=A0ABS6YLB2_9ACTN|nr:hypothetical protein [Streptomyces anatolicus]MBW5421347.1 hypothetical protein [Streptomyces anatolicus]